MGWNNGRYCVDHPREPWGAAKAEIFVHTSLKAMYGDEDQKHQYKAAKLRFDQAAADLVAERCMTDKAIDGIVDQLFYHGGEHARLVVPHPDFADPESPSPNNAIPFAYAGRLSETLGLEVDEEILQVSRVGRTKLNRMQRFLYQPSFGGAVRRDQPYIIVDDVVTTAGTMAALRSYIVRNGGRVLFATVLAHKSGKNQRLPITDGTYGVLQRFLGGGLEPFWLETIGHNVTCLTENEARVLGEWCDEKIAEGTRAGEPLLQRLRARLNEIASK
jgi:hypothetical protein